MGFSGHFPYIHLLACQIECTSHYGRPASYCIKTCQAPPGQIKKCPAQGALHLISPHVLPSISTMVSSGSYPVYMFSTGPRILASGIPLYPVLRCPKFCQFSAASLQPSFPSLLGISSRQKRTGIFLLGFQDFSDRFHTKIAHLAQNSSPAMSSGPKIPSSPVSEEECHHFSVKNRTHMPAQARSFFASADNVLLPAFSIFNKPSRFFITSTFHALFVYQRRKILPFFKPTSLP